MFSNNTPRTPHSPSPGADTPPVSTTPGRIGNGASSGGGNPGHRRSISPSLLIREVAVSQISAGLHRGAPGGERAFQGGNAERTGAAIEQTDMHNGDVLKACDRAATLPPVHTSVAPIVALRVVAQRKETTPMPRTQPITAQLVDVALDLKLEFHTLAMADGVITATEAEIAALINRVLVKTERLDRSRVISRNIEDHGTVTPYALRMAREMERDLGNVVRIDDYRTDTQTPA